MNVARQTTTLAILVLGLSPLPQAAAQSSPSDSEAQIRQVIAAAFADSHDGWSSDEVILQVRLNRQFVAECQKSLPQLPASELNWQLITLRKAGRLKVKTTRRDPRSCEELQPLAEICARTLIDRYGISVDRMMTDPLRRAEFDAAAVNLAPDVDTYLVRKAAFHLRKSRQLRPELVTRIADWGRVVSEYRLADLADDLSPVPAGPGLYIFRDASGYLYIGEAIDLRARLSQHLDGSDRVALAEYLRQRSVGEIMVEVHTFEENSRIRETLVRRAYESELIRSRNPRFNIRP